MTINLHKSEAAKEQTPSAPADAPGDEAAAACAPTRTCCIADDVGDGPDPHDPQVVGDAEESEELVGRALAFPDLRPYVVVKGGRKALVRGTVVIIRWAYGVSTGRPARARPASGDKAAEAGSGDRKREEGERITADVVLATVFVGGCAALTAARYIPYLLIFVMFVFLPAAYLVGAWTAENDGGEAEGRTAPPGDGAEGAPDADMLGDTPVPQGELGSKGCDKPQAEDKSALAREPTEAEQQIALYEWVRGMIGKKNGVHLRTLLDDLNHPRMQEGPEAPMAGLRALVLDELNRQCDREGLEAVSLADLRALLEARGIPVHDQVKVNRHNRSGVKRTDLPEGVTPLLGPDGHAVRLLPRLPPSDLH
ncbi:hypothetical protein AB0N77_21245 [Streptomyces misionensis]|uniref:hypothetical protein n=1 Tax=Streptomyces misionensis TaxID=67331 RepID=UPI0034138CFB